MPASATFTANFTSYFQGLANAKIKTVDFSNALLKVDREVSRAFDDFSGRRVIQEANVLTRAFQDIGDVSKLTSTEAAKLSSILENASDKMRRWGMEVPANMKALSESLKPIPQQLSLADKAATALRGTFAQMTASFTAATVIDRVATGLFNFGREAFESASQLVDLRDQTKLSLGTLQEMQHVAAETGTELSTLTNASFELTKRIGQGKEGLRGAVTALGLDLGALREATREDQFLTLMKALEGVKDETELVRFGTAVFGNDFKAMTAIVTSGYSKIAEGANKSSDAQIEALERAAKAMERQARRIDQMKVSILGAASQNIEAIARAWEKVEFTGGIFGLASASVRERAAADAQPGDIKLPTSASNQEIVDYIARLQQVTAETAKLTAEQRKQIAAALDLGESVQGLADKYGVSVQAIKAANEQFQLQQRLIGTPLIDSAKGMLEAIRGLTSQGLQPMRSEWASIVDMMTSAQRAMESTGRAGEEMYQRMEAARRQFSGLRPDGTLPSTNLGVGLAQAPHITPDLAMATAGQDAANEFWRRAIEQQDVMREAVEATAEAHKHASDAAVAGAADSTKGYSALHRQLLEVATAIKIAVPAGFSFADAYRDAGLFVNDLAGAAAGIGGRLDSRRGFSDRAAMPVTQVTVNAQGSFWNDAASMQRLADTVGRSLNDRMRGFA